MPGVDVVDEYLKLGLRFGRVVDGFVDAYTGAPALRQAVDNEPAPEPDALSRQAGELLRALPDAGLAVDRSAFLAAQLSALEVAGRRLAGQAMSFAAEVRGCFQVDIALTDTDIYAQAHRDLDRLLPGSGPVGPRLEGLRAREVCPPELVGTVVSVLATDLRQKVVGPTGLPGSEHIEFEIERDVAWSGFNYYLGEFRSRVAVNADATQRMSQLPVLVAHECYPGHHTEHCRKELLLVRASGQAEQSIFLVNTPQCVMAEGLGDLALSAAIGPDWGRWAAAVLDGIGPGFDPDLAQALEVAARPLNSVRQNAAILLNDGGASESEAVDYLRTWGLVDENRARQSMRFLTDPLWRAYTSTYVEGERLLRPWLKARPAEQSAMQRFQRLLDEPLTPDRIRSELASVSS